MATAERKRPTKAAKAEPRDHLTMRLFAPGMTILHRAGLGGLACTLKYIERAYAGNALTDEDVPGGPWPQPDQPPWIIEDDSITLRLGKPEGARDYLSRLSGIAFQVKDGLIDLPGQHPGLPPAFAVRAELQNGLTLSFLQHGKTRDLAKTPSTVQVDPTGDGLSLVTIEYKCCGGYKHQTAWEDLIDNKGRLVEKEVPIEGPLNPGAVVRHNAFSADTKASDPPERILPLYFALVGCLALPVNRGVGVLIVPDVENLRDFPADRAAMTPTSALECRVAGSGDAVLQAMVRLRARGLAESARMPGCLAVRFQPTTWSTQQKSRVSAFAADFRNAIRFAPEERSDADLALERFEVALALLPPRVPEPKSPSASVKATRGKQGKAPVKKADGRHTFWADSVIRPLVADNLARGRFWYRDFAQLAASQDQFAKLGFERKGLQIMAESKTMLDGSEMPFVQAVHRAIYRGLGKIYGETMGKAAAAERRPATPAVKNRWKKYILEVRLALLGAKTPSQVQLAVNKLFANAGGVHELRDDEAAARVMELLFGSDWRRVQSLSLFALASYKRPAKAETIPGTEDIDAVDNG